MKLFCVAMLLSCCHVYSELLLDGARSVVDLHNRLRRLVGRSGQDRVSVANMQKLVWDANLALDASLLTHCNMEMLPWQPLEYSITGIPTKAASLGYGRRNSSLASIIRRWFREGKYYDKEFNVCQYGHTCQRYMQIVSAKSTRIGCAVKTGCKRKDIGLTGYSYKVLMCIYAPGLDYRLNEAAPLFEEGTPCSHCEQPTPFCNKGLCSACNSDKCECSKTCHDPGVGYGILNKETCTCECLYGSGPNCDKPCVNPEQYLDYDICSDITPEDCNDPEPDTREILQEFCPEQCACKPVPQVLEVLGIQ